MLNAFWLIEKQCLWIYVDVIKNVDTTQKLLKLDPCDKKIHKPVDTIDVSIGAQLHITKYKKASNYKGIAVKEFYKGAIHLLSNIVKHMLEKCPLKYQLVCCSSCMNLNILAVNDCNDA